MDYYEKMCSYDVLDWINIKKLNWEFLSSNPNAIQLLEKNPEKLVGVMYPSEKIGTERFLEY
jgi:hypothetical protein